MKRAADRRVVWRRLDAPGTESLRLHFISNRPNLDGIVETTFDGRPARVRYRIECGEDWRPRVARIRSLVGTRRSEHMLFVDEVGAWC